MKECIILGRGPTRIDCQYDKPVWTVSWFWDFNPPRVDKVFTVHKWEEESIDEFKKGQERYGYEIIAPVTHPELKVTTFPIEEVLNHFKNKFFSDLICYMMAYGIAIEKIERFWWYGIDCMGYTTYTMERGGMEFWAGVAKGGDIDVINTKDSATLRPKKGMYGIWGDRQEEINSLLLKESKFELAHLGINSPKAGVR